MKTFNIKNIESVLGYSFQNPDLLLQAFSRSSFAEESAEPWESNETLEFIGDTVLSTVIVKKLAARYGRTALPADRQKAVQEEVRQKHGMELYNWFTTPLCNEKELSEWKIRLVSGKTLAAAMDRLGLQEYLLMSKGDISENVQEQASVKEDLLEAILGAVALDCGWDFAVIGSVVDRLLEPERILEEGFPGDPDYVAEFEAWYLEKYGKQPEYEVQHRPEESLPYHCSQAFVPAFNGFDWFYYGHGKTREGAIRDYARRMMISAVEAEQARKRYLEALGDTVDLSRAVNILQELWQKGLISEPVYDFQEFSLGKETRGGNPAWICNCVSDGCAYGTAMADSKTKAKKDAAANALHKLIEETHPLMPR